MADPRQLQLGARREVAGAGVLELGDALREELARLVRVAQRDQRGRELEAGPAPLEVVVDALHELAACSRAGVEVAVFPLRDDVRLERPERPPLLADRFVVIERAARVVDAAQWVVLRHHDRADRAHDGLVPLVVQLDRLGDAGLELARSGLDVAAHRRDGPERRVHDRFLVAIERVRDARERVLAGLRRAHHRVEVAHPPAEQCEVHAGDRDQPVVLADPGVAQRVLRDAGRLREIPDAIRRERQV